MKSFVEEYTRNDGACGVCGKETETVRHIVLECGCTPQNPYVGTLCPSEAPGFKASEEIVNYCAVEVTKKRSECWRRKSRERNQA